jgi:hypothetical protein
MQSPAKRQLTVSSALTEISSYHFLLNFIKDKNVSAYWHLEDTLDKSQPLSLCSTFMPCIDRTGLHSNEVVLQRCE